MPPGFTLVKEKAGFREFRLEANGLSVLLLSNRVAPVATFAVVYHVGSRNEAVGHTGATHLLEHLMFKGSANFNKEKGNKVDQILDPIGASNNATTSVDRTNYYETPVSDYIESFKINTIAPAMICYHFLPKMISRGFGRIVNTTSGIRLEPEQAGYSASKAALDKITIDLGSKLEGTDVLINLTDPGWCRTDLGGSHAPNAPESTIPGIVVGAFIDDKKSGRYFSAQSFTGMTLEQAVAKAECNLDSPYSR